MHRYKEWGEWKEGRGVGCERSVERVGEEGCERRRKQGIGETVREREKEQGEWKTDTEGRKTG